MSLVAVALAERIENAIEAVSGPWLYLVAGLLTFAETGTLFFLIPGEIGLLVAGAAAGAGDLSLPVMLVVANVAAILGDATGFAIGRRFGPGLQHSRLGRKLGVENWRRAEQLIQRRKGLIVLLGRWIGFLRAIMPATAGMSGMSYRTFLPWDLAGCITWASTCVIGGYLLGDNWTELAAQLGKLGWVLLAVAIVAVVVHKLLGRRLKRVAPSEAAGVGQGTDQLTQPGGEVQRCAIAQVGADDLDADR
jgi:undecaprenyl-diphosphatase